MLYSMVTTIGLSIVAKPSPNLMRLMSAILALFVDQEFIMLMARMRKDDLATLAQLMEAGEMRPVIDRTWPLNQVAQAIRYSESGRARGKIVINIE
jgi:NADPH:quinone reductase-like Zn-dependent oxidoreductase